MIERSISRFRALLDLLILWPLYIAIVTILIIVRFTREGTKAVWSVLVEAREELPRFWAITLQAFRQLKTGVPE